MILRITLIGLMAGVLGTGLGGVLSGIFKKKVDKYIDFFMGLSAETLGFTLAIVIGIHNVPEGLATALTLAGTKMKTSKIILYTVIAGIPMGIGSFLGVYFAGNFNSLIGVFLSIAAGTMLYVVLEEILPRTKNLFCIIGFLIGTIIVYCI